MDQFFSYPYSTDRRRVLPLWYWIFPRYMPNIRLIDLSHEKSRVHRVRTGSLLVAVSMVSAFYCTSNDKRDKVTYDHHVGSSAQDQPAVSNTSSKRFHPHQRVSHPESSLSLPAPSCTAYEGHLTRPLELWIGDPGALCKPAILCALATWSHFGV